jgi:hypothetical protein
MSDVYVPDRRIGLTDIADCRSSGEKLMFELCHGSPLPNKVMSIKRLNEWVHRMFQLWTIFDHSEVQSPPV